MPGASFHTQARPAPIFPGVDAGDLILAEALGLPSGLGSSYTYGP